jgi:hypothetical protein
MPAGLRFAAAFGDVGAVLVFEAAGKQPPAPGLAVRAALDVGPLTVDESRWMTVGEQEAYRAGQADAFDAVRRAVTNAAGTEPT